MSEPRKAKRKLYTSTFTFEGKRYYVRSSVSQRDADKKAALKQKEMEDNTEILSPSTTVAEYSRLWLATYIENTIQRPSYLTIKSRMETVFLPAVGRMRLRDVRPTHLQKIFATRPGHSKDYYVKLRQMMYRIFAQAVRDHLIRDNPAETLKIPNATDGTHRSLTDEERRAVLFTADWHSFGLFVELMLWCGLRPQEAAVLRWEDIDQINHTIHIQRALKNDGSIGAPKSAAGNRIIPIPPQLWIRLLPRLPENGYVLRPTRLPYYTRMAIKEGWKAFKRALDITMGAEYITHNRKILIVRSVLPADLQMYCMRHTYCTDLQTAGVPINVAKELMGHSSIELTARIYTHMTDDTFRSAAEKIAAFGATVSATLCTDKPPIRAVLQDNAVSDTAGNIVRKIAQITK